LVPNPINHYWVGADTPGITYNKYGSLDVYIQPESKTGKTEQLAIISYKQPVIQYDLCVCIGLTNRHLTEHGHHHQYSEPIQRDSKIHQSNFRIGILNAHALFYDVDCKYHLNVLYRYEVLKP
jgi:hypothetical protein